MYSGANDDAALAVAVFAICCGVVGAAVDGANDSAVAFAAAVCCGAAVDAAVAAADPLPACMDAKWVSTGIHIFSNAEYMCFLGTKHARCSQKTKGFDAASCCNKLHSTQFDDNVEVNTFICEAAPRTYI
jgi:hypothetical protein